MIIIQEGFHQIEMVERVWHTKGGVLLKILNSIIYTLIILAWAMLGGYVANKFSNGNQLIEVCGVISGSSVGLFLAWSIESLANELKRQKAK